MYDTDGTDAVVSDGVDDEREEDGDEEDEEENRFCRYGIVNGKLNGVQLLWSFSGGAGW